MKARNKTHKLRELNNCRPAQTFPFVVCV